MDLLVQKIITNQKYIDVDVHTMLVIILVIDIAQHFELY
jgi:hypothetical protein